MIPDAPGPPATRRANLFASLMLMTLSGALSLVSPGPLLLVRSPAKIRHRDPALSVVAGNSRDCMSSGRHTHQRVGICH